MQAGGLTEKVAKDRVLALRFYDVGTLPPPVLQFQNVSFGYSADKPLYKNLEFGVDLDSRIALVGPNGVGKVKRKKQTFCFLLKHANFFLNFSPPS
jgi:ATP-binding cassette, subfamily F, member 2